VDEILSLDPDKFRDQADFMAAVLLQDAARLIADLMPLLSLSQQEVIELRYHHDMTFEDIGPEMSITPQAARQLHGRALKALGFALLSRSIKSTSDVL
jgi:DNA-directed RNA polymerase specialized sigma24 family protein